MNSLKNYKDDADTYKKKLNNVIQMIDTSTNPLYFSFLVQLYKKFKQIIDGLKYADKIYADAGTLLGISRYGGFMPWDDDIDLCFIGTSHDYNDFALKVIRECLNNNLDIYLYMRDERYTYHENYTKGMMVGKHVVHNLKNRWEINVDNINLNSIVFFNVSDYRNYYKFISSFNIDMELEEKFKSGHLKTPWIDVFPMEKINDEQYKYTRFFGQSSWGNSNHFVPYLKSDIMPLKTIDLFGTKFNIPNKASEYLIKEYNDVDVIENVILYPKHGKGVGGKIAIKNDSLVREFVGKYNLHVLLFG